MRNLERLILPSCGSGVTYVSGIPRLQESIAKADVSLGRTTVF